LRTFELHLRLFIEASGQVESEGHNTSFHEGSNVIKMPSTPF